MSDVPPDDDAAERRAAAEVARLQQQALEQQLRAAELERALEHSRNEQAVLAERRRLAQGKRAALTRARRTLRAARRRLDPRGGQQPRGYPLAALPVVAGSAAPRWSAAVDVRGVLRPAFFADPPASHHWELDVPAGAALRGWVALRPGAWQANAGGVDLILELHDQRGVLVGRQVTAIDPAARAADRRWVPWAWSLPASGPHRLTIRTQSGGGSAGEYAWAVVGDPRFVFPGLPRLEAGRRLTLRRRLATIGGSAFARPASTVLTFLLPVHDPEPGLLDRTLASVRDQTEGRWQLCIVDDGSRDPAVHERLARAALDPRVRLHRHEAAAGISGATNAALAMAQTEFVATLDHDDVLAPDAVERILGALTAAPATDLLYTDNDLLAGDGHRFSAALKPDWSPDLLRACMYTLHLSVYRRSLVEQLGGWRGAFDGAQDHDLVLRLSEQTANIRHLPKILYHWRAHAGSAALGELAKPLAYERGREAVAAQLQRLGRAGTVERLPQAGRYRVRYARSRPLTVLVAVRAGDGASLREAAGPLLAALREHDRVRLLPVGPGAAGDARAAAQAAGDPRLQVARGAAATLGAALAAIVGELSPDATVVVLEAAFAPPGPDAFDELAGHVEAGAVAAGGLVLSASDHVLAGGLAFPAGLPVPLHPDVVAGPDAHPALTMASNRTAVRGAVALTYRQLAAHAPAAAGLDQLALVALTAAASAGGRVVWSPHARFTADQAQAAALLRWPLAEAAALDRGDRPDPFWNPQRWPDRGDETIPEAVHENPLIDLPDA